MASPYVHYRNGVLAGIKLPRDSAGKYSYIEGLDDVPIRHQGPVIMLGKRTQGKRTRHVGVLYGHCNDEPVWLFGFYHARGGISTNLFVGRGNEPFGARSHRDVDLSAYFEFVMNSPSLKGKNMQIHKSEIITFCAEEVIPGAMEARKNTKTGNWADMIPRGRPLLLRYNSAAPSDSESSDEDYVMDSADEEYSEHSPQFARHKDAESTARKPAGHQNNRHYHYHHQHHHHQQQMGMNCPPTTSTTMKDIDTKPDIESNQLRIPENLSSHAATAFAALAAQLQAEQRQSQVWMKMALNTRQENENADLKARVEQLEKTVGHLEEELRYEKRKKLLYKNGIRDYLRGVDGGGHAQAGLGKNGPWDFSGKEEEYEEDLQYEHN